MKKLLLTLAVGIAMLSLPVFASAAVIGGGGFDTYSGYTASVVYRGFRTYSTAKGATAGFKHFIVREFANISTTGPKNTTGVFEGGVNFISIWLNAHTVVNIDAPNAVAPPNGRVIKATGAYMLYHTTGALTLVPYFNGVGHAAQNIPASGGLTATEDVIYGSCAITAYNNPKTHAMVLKISAPTAEWDNTDMYTSVAGSPNSWSQTGSNYNMVAATETLVTGDDVSNFNAVVISPIRLKSMSYYGPWWNLNIPSMPPFFILFGFL